MGLILLTPAYAQAPQTGLPVATLRAGMQIIRAEVAATEPTRMRGLMFRQSLPLNTGMLFIFEKQDRHCFWMRNTPLPLSIAFLADDGTILSIEKMKPLSESNHCPPKAVRFALEMEHGWFAKRGVRVGATLRSKDPVFNQ